ncbi:hypothetical protein GCM10029976_028890 [Kribbella albertanoniae]
MSAVVTSDATKAARGEGPLAVQFLRHDLPAVDLTNLKVRRLKTWDEIPPAADARDLLALVSDRGTLAASHSSRYCEGAVPSALPFLILISVAAKSG